MAFFLLESQHFLQILRSDSVQGLPFVSDAARLARTAVQYFGIRTRLNVLTGLGLSIVRILVGVDYPLLWGGLAFVLSYIPYIGLFTALNLTIENIVEPGKVRRGGRP